jgi:hypothetical protein
MPPSQRVVRTTQSRLDDVDAYIEERALRRVRRAEAEDRPPERHRRDLMRAEFAWSEAPRRSRARRPAGPLVVEAGPGPAEADPEAAWTGRLLADSSSESPPRGTGLTEVPAPVRANYDVPRDLPATPSSKVLARAWDDAVEARAGVIEAVAAERGGSPAPASPVAEAMVPQTQRRTIVITGHGADRRLASRPRGYDARVARHERSSFKPDRMAMWAVLLGLALLLAAATSSHAAVLHAAAQLH